MKTVNKRKPRESLVADPIDILDVIIEDAGGQFPKPNKQTRAPKQRKARGAKRGAKNSDR